MSAEDLSEATRRLLDQRAAQAATDAAERRIRSAGARRQFAETRRVGLDHRHARKVPQNARPAEDSPDARFGVWLTRQTDRQDAVGDLARTYTAPCSCALCAGRTSRRYSVNGVRGELDDHGASAEAYAALDQAAEEWRAAPRGKP